MNCGPVKKPEAKYSYTGTNDGDFVIWKGETFVTNVGGAALAEVGKQQIAFDVDKENAELIVNALNQSRQARATIAAQAEQIERLRTACQSAKSFIVSCELYETRAGTEIIAELRAALSTKE